MKAKPPVPAGQKQVHCASRTKNKTLLRGRTLGSLPGYMGQTLGQPDSRNQEESDGVTKETHSERLKRTESGPDEEEGGECDPKSTTDPGLPMQTE